MDPIQRKLQSILPHLRKEFMINYRVENLEALAEDLKKRV